MNEPSLEVISEINLSAYPAIWIPLSFPIVKENSWERICEKSLGKKTALSDYLKARVSKPKPNKRVVFDLSSSQKVTITILPKKATQFLLLETARHGLQSLLENQPDSVLIDLRNVGDLHYRLADAAVAAFSCLLHKGPKYRKTPTKTPGHRKCVLVVSEEQVEKVKEVANRSLIEAAGTNLVRKLSLMAGNDLTSARYVATAKDLAEAEGLRTTFFSLDELAKLKAGAFLAVAKGSEDKGAGILKVVYEPKGSENHIALVGKGITFDTGGNNIKTGSYMYGMHTDMAGSAVALALVLIAKKMNWKVKVSAYLAITDNILGPKSYRPNDVVTSLKGKTIEIVDTDAEGRLILADTLHLAALDKPNLILDFATLTGACIRAIGTRYSGAYSNSTHLYPLIRRAGRLSGERVWPFPNDPDYGKCLKSSMADMLQCRVSGGVDHIEAAYFLSQFVPRKLPWVHVDLSSIQCEGGLAHVPTKFTGFGVRFASKFVELMLAKTSY